MRKMAFVLVLTFSCLAAANAQDIAPLAGTLVKIFDAFPSMRALTDPVAFRQAAAAVLSGREEAALAAALSGDRAAFLRAREQALHQSTPPAVSRRALVSGGSISGLTAAAVLARSGYQVDLYEIRPDYTRNIQWAGRQALIDELASLDTDLARRFTAEVARPAHVSTHLVDSPPSRRQYDQPAPLVGDPLRLGFESERWLSQPSTVIMEAKTFERFLRQYVESLPGVIVHSGEKLPVLSPDSRGNFAAAGQPPPDLVVLAEGATSPTARAVGIERAPTSPPRRQIAGTVDRDIGGQMIKHYRTVQRADGTTETLLTGLMGRAGSKTWVVADIPSDVSFEATPGSGRSPDSPQRQAAQQRQMEGLLREAAGRALEMPAADVASLKVDAAVEGRPMSSFVLQQHIARSAVAGRNVVAVGDIVGNGHWSVGGGMQVGAVGHAERLKRLLFDLDRGVAREAALQTFDRSVQADTRAWGRAGIHDFYKDAPGAKEADALVAAERAWRDGKVRTPLELMPASSSSRGGERIALLDVSSSRLAGSAAKNVGFGVMVGVGLEAARQVTSGDKIDGSRLASDTVTNWSGFWKPILGGTAGAMLAGAVASRLVPGARLWIAGAELLGGSLGGSAAAGELTADPRRAAAGAVGATVGSLVAGAALSAVLGPPGMAVGSLLGGMVGQTLGEALAGRSPVAASADRAPRS